MELLKEGRGQAATLGSVRINLHGCGEKRTRINLIGSLSFASVKLAALRGISECQNKSNGTGQNLDAR